MEEIENFTVNIQIVVDVCGCCPATMQVSLFGACIFVVKGRMKIPDKKIYAEFRRFFPGTIEKNYQRPWENTQQNIDQRR